MFVFSSLLMAQEKAAAPEKTPVKAEHKYVGAAKCKMCHNSPAKGEQFKKWTDSKHSKAFETLASPAALEVGKKLSIDKPQESDKCLGCHVTGFSAPATVKAATFAQTEGVGCEACHGPGSDYMAMKVMKDKPAALAAGLNIPNEKTCIGCHNDKSPTYKTFVFADFLKQIAHPIPKGNDAGKDK
jgi:hypothetical protein